MPQACSGILCPPRTVALRVSRERKELKLSAGRPPTQQQSWEATETPSDVDRCEH